MEIPVNVGLIVIAVCVLGIAACLVWWATFEKPRRRDGCGGMDGGGSAGGMGGGGGGL
ncbi:hypothetical protein [Streptomyces mayteni]